MSKDKQTKFAASIPVQISVVARPAAGFRRAGYSFSADKPTVIETEDLEEEQLAQLLNEPNLVVVPYGGKAEQPEPADTSALEAELAEAQKKLTDAAAADKEQKAELEALRKKLAEAEGKLAEAQKKLTDAAAADKEQKAELEALRKKLAEAEGKLADAEKQLKAKPESGKGKDNK